MNGIDLLPSDCVNSTSLNNDVQARMRRIKLRCEDEARMRSYDAMLGCEVRS